MELDVKKFLESVEDHDNFGLVSCYDYARDNPSPYLCITLHDGNIVFETRESIEEFILSLGEVREFLADHDVDENTRMLFWDTTTSEYFKLDSLFHSGHSISFTLNK